MKGRPCSRRSAPGRMKNPPYFFPIATVAVPVGETQPEDVISVTERVTEPFAPAVNVTWFAPCPAVIDPLEMLQLYRLPEWLVTEAVRPDWLGFAEEGAEIVGADGVAETVTIAVAAFELVPSRVHATRRVA